MEDICLSYPIPLLTRFLYQFFMEFFSNTWCKLLNYELCLSILFIRDMWFNFSKKKRNKIVKNHAAFKLAQLELAITFISRHYSKTRL